VDVTAVAEVVIDLVHNFANAILVDIAHLHIGSIPGNITSN
jgi:hypothetical protein